MTQPKTLIRVLFLLSLSTLLGLTCSAQNRAILHNVEKGETLYRISKQYGISVSEILTLNPGLTAETLKTGNTILIPEKSANNGAVNPNCRIMHKAKKKETIWSIASQYGITVEQLTAANPQMQAAGYKLRKGDFVCIPYRYVELKKEPVGYPELKLCVVLPLKDKGEIGLRSVEFYRGFLMAVNKVKKNGKNITIHAINEPTASASLSPALSVLRGKDYQLIVGPLYPNHFDDLSSFTESEKMRWLVPFSSKVAEVEKNKHVFLVNAPEKLKSTFAGKLFVRTFPTKTKVVFLHSKNGNENAFVNDMRSRLAREGYSIADLYDGYTAEDMKKLLSAGERTVFIPNASTNQAAESTLQRITQLRAIAPRAEFSLVGYPEWVPYATQHAESFYSADAYLFANYYHNTYDSRTKDFEREYKEWFGTEMLETQPHMGLLGYDTALFMMQGLLKYGDDFATQELPENMLQSDLHFVRPDEDAGCINDCMQFIHYRRDCVIEKITINKDN